MGEEPQPRMISKGDYASGIAVANGPVWILNIFRDILMKILSTTLHMLILGFTTLFGCFLASYLIAKKTGERYQRAGLTTGLLSYLAYVVLSWIIGLERIPLEDPITITGFVGGGILGAYHWWTTQLPQDSSKETSPT